MPMLFSKLALNLRNLEKTIGQYEAVIKTCKMLFLKKARDYGTSWKILRMPSVTDQIFIKAERIRSLQETGVNKVGEDIEGEFIGIVNYCVIALLLWQAYKLGKKLVPAKSIDASKISQEYDQTIKTAFDTMMNKNHDYGEAWRNMRISSMTDLILMKIFRLKQIEDHDGSTLVSEGPDANYIDMLNYAVFCLIKISEAETINNPE